MRADGYACKDCTFSLKRAQVLGIALALPFAAASVAAVFFAGPRAMFAGRAYLDLLLFSAAALLSIPVHEGLHGLVWGAVNTSFRGIRFGILREGLTPYCACETPMNRARYLAGCLAPFVVLGLGFAAAGAVTGFTALSCLGAFNAVSAGGDLLVALKMLAAGGGVALDHPAACGFYLFQKEKKE